MTLKPCACGGRTFTKRTPVRGIYSTFLTLQEDGTINIEGDGDGIRDIRQPKTIRCDECGKRHPNPDYDT